MTRFSKSYNFNDFWFSKMLNEDVYIQCSAYEEGWSEKATYNNPSDGEFKITADVKFKRFDEDENEIELDEETEKKLRKEFLDWLYDHEELFKDC